MFDESVATQKRNIVSSFATNIMQELRLSSAVVNSRRMDFSSFNKNSLSVGKHKKTFILEKEQSKSVG